MFSRVTGLINRGQKLKGTVVLMRKNVLDINELTSAQSATGIIGGVLGTTVDTITSFLGRSVALKLISSTSADGADVEAKTAPINEKELVLDGGFVMPQTNSFGHTFRDYDAESERQEGVENFYRKNHIYQSVDFVKKMREEYGKLNRVEMSIWECCELLNEVVDESDPDLDEPQIEHLLQTAEAIRKNYPNEDWLHLTGLIHGSFYFLMIPLLC